MLVDCRARDTKPTSRLWWQLRWWSEKKKKKKKRKHHPRLMIPQWYSPFWDPGISQKGPGVQTQWRCVQEIQLDLLVVPSANGLDLGLACFNACLFVRVGSAVVLQNKKKKKKKKKRNKEKHNTTTIRWHFGGKCLVMSCRRTFLNLVVTWVNAACDLSSSRRRTRRTTTTKKSLLGFLFVVSVSFGIFWVSVRKWVPSLWTRGELKARQSFCLLVRHSLSQSLLSIVTPLCRHVHRLVSPSLNLSTNFASGGARFFPTRLPVAYCSSLQPACTWISVHSMHGWWLGAGGLVKRLQQRFPAVAASLLCPVT